MPRPIAALGLIFAFFWGSTATGEPCRTAFDLGSSGIRAGSSMSTATARADIDFLEPLWAGHGMAENVPPTIAALRELPRKAGFPTGCNALGGGFSAWRLAAQQDSVTLVGQLARIRAASGVPVLVIPQDQEGRYGYFGARAVLGAELQTSHVIDIGGGSLQIAGAEGGFGALLGQKAWARRLCQSLRGAGLDDCRLQPMAGDDLARARALAAAQWVTLPATLPVGRMSLTAISRPVTRGVLPALNRLQGGDSQRIEAIALSAAIDRLAGLTLHETAALTSKSPNDAAFLLSTMLLLESVMQATGVAGMQVAELDLSNLPGLLADDRAFAWTERYACYLTRLAMQGEAAYASDPATCRPNIGRLHDDFSGQPVEDVGAPAFSPTPETHWR